jgi:cephalosporin hydroxylase
MNKYKLTQNFNYGGQRNEYAGALSNVKHLVESIGYPSTMIEIGCYEGGSTFWFADSLCPLNKNLKIYAIDPHTTSEDISENIEDAKNNFLYNLSVCDYKNQIEYIQKTSNVALVDLISKGIKSELIYIDGDHRSPEVLTDLVLSFELLQVGGILLCDDSVYWRHSNKESRKLSPDPSMSPRMAVETFIMCNWRRIKIVYLPDSSQTGILKLC